MSRKQKPSWSLVQNSNRAPQSRIIIAPYRNGVTFGRETVGELTFLPGRQVSTSDRICYFNRQVMRAFCIS